MHPVLLGILRLLINCAKCVQFFRFYQCDTHKYFGEAHFLDALYIIEKAKCAGEDMSSYAGSECGGGK